MLLESEPSNNNNMVRLGLDLFSELCGHVAKNILFELEKCINYKPFSLVIVGD